MFDPAHGYGALVAAWTALSRTHAVEVRCVPCDRDGRSLLVLDIAPDPSTQCVALCAGVHGDEPAAPWALLSLVRDALLDRRFAYRAWCCTNPTGYEAETRANADGDDINRSYSRDGRNGSTPEARAVERENRDRRFTLSLDLHEDYEADGFYCYEPVVAGTAPLGRHVVQAVDDAGFAVQELAAGYDLGYPTDAAHLRQLERGRVLPNVEEEVRHFGAGLPYSMYLLWTGMAQRAMTLETPRRRAWDERIAIHRVAVVTALTVLGRV